jgi:tetratricopeptide (TPR) repeat protein
VTPADDTYRALAALANGPVSDAIIARAAELSRAEQSLRAAVLYAVLLLRAGKLDDAGTQLQAAQKRFGDDPAVLINLAKLSQARGDSDKALALGRKALEVSGDDEIGLGFWASLMRMCGRAQELMAELPKLKGFRPLLWLAAIHVELGAEADAEKAYAAALSAAPDKELCAQTLARDLRLAGKNALLVRVLAPRFGLAQHGRLAGLALAAAHAELNQLAEADALLEQLRPTVPAQALAELEALLVTKRVEQPSTAPARLKGAPMIGPVWAAPLQQAGLALAPRSASHLVGFAQLADCTGDRYTVLEGASVGGATPLEEACRAVPLFLSEAFTLTTAATGMALLATHGDEGLVSFRDPLTPEAALELAHASALPRIVVLGFFSRAVTQELELQLTAFDLATGGRPLQLRVAKGEPIELALRAERELKALLELDEKPALFTRPAMPDARYLDVTHRVLPLVLAAQGRLDKKRLWGIGATLEAAESLTRAEAKADTPALLLAAAVLAGAPQSSGFKKTAAEALAPFAWKRTLKGL